MDFISDHLNKVIVYLLVYIVTFKPSNYPSSLIAVSWGGYLKVVSSWKGKVWQFTFLWTPWLAEKGVPDKLARFDVWVNVQSDVVWLAAPQINSKTWEKKKKNNN